jgi:hypothetical protein
VRRLLTDVVASPKSAAEVYVTQLEDAGIRGCQGRDSGAAAGCDHVSAGVSFDTSQTAPTDKIEVEGLTLSAGGVGADDILEFTLAAGELTLLVRGGHVVGASD